MEQALGQLPTTGARGIVEFASGGVLGIGHSHLTCLQFAQAAFEAEFEYMPAVHFVQILDPEFRGELGAIDLDRVESRIRDLKDRKNIDSTFACYSGNEYHVISMIQHPQPFDFVMPGFEHIKLTADVQIIPFEIIADQMRSALEESMINLARLRDSIGGLFYVISSPPPIPDNVFLQQRQNAFWDRGASLGVSPPSFRFKIWRIQSDIYKDACDRIGALYVEPPASAVDKVGFMRREGWHPDGVHGNTWYGRELFLQLLGRA